MGHRSALLAIVPLLLFADPASAGYTSFEPPPAGERSHAEILSSTYGGSFVPDGLDFSNELDVTAMRITDSGCAPEEAQSKGCSLGPDQIWEISPAVVTARASDADLTQSFGWNEGMGPGGLGPFYAELVDEVLPGPVAIQPTGSFLWAIHPSSGDTFWSKDALNPDGADHMLTYLITGLPGPQTVWLTFWEDLPSPGWDADYNDFVIEIRSVPELGALWLLALGLTATRALRGRR
jgi:hypothetical protein